MDEPPPIYSNLSVETQFGLNKINEINNYFVGETREREIVSKRIKKDIRMISDKSNTEKKTD